MNNVYKLVETIAGSTFNIVSANIDCPAPIFTLEHCKCGNKFEMTLNEISVHGIHCDRCERPALRSTILKDTKRMKALHIYNQCKGLIPEGFTVKGDTSDESNVLEIEDNHGNIYNIVIKDLFENNDLPDCLARREIMEPSVALQILDTLFEDCTVLDEFSALTDVVRVKSNIDYVVKEMSVKELLESKLDYE